MVYRIIPEKVIVKSDLSKNFQRVRRWWAHTVKNFFVWTLYIPVKSIFSALHEEILTVSGGWLRTPVSSVFKILWSFKCSSSFILFLAKFLPTLYFSSGLLYLFMTTEKQTCSSFFSFVFFPIIVFLSQTVTVHGTAL